MLNKKYSPLPKKPTVKDPFTDYVKDVTSTPLDEAKIQSYIDIKDGLGDNALHIIARRIAISANSTANDAMISNARLLLNAKKELNQAANNQGLTPAELLLYMLEDGTIDAKTHGLELYKLVTDSNHKKQIENVLAAQEKNASECLEFLQKLSTSNYELGQYIASEAGIKLDRTEQATGEESALVQTSSAVGIHASNLQPPQLPFQNISPQFFAPLSNTMPQVYFAASLPPGTTATIETTFTTSQQPANPGINTIVNQTVLQNIQRDFQTLPKLPIASQQELAIAFIANSDLDHEQISAAFEQGAQKREKRKRMEIEDRTSVNKLARSSSSETTSSDAQLFDLGVKCSNEGKHEEALQHHLQALTLRERKLPPSDLELSVSYMEIGNCYGRLKDYNSALSYHERSLALYKKLLPEYHHLIAGIMLNIGIDYSGMNEHKKSLEHLITALDIMQKISTPNSPDLMPSLSVVIASYQKINNHDKALEYQLKALDILRTPAPTTNLATLLYQIGSTCLTLNDKKAATEYLEEARDIFRSLSDSTNANKCQDELEKMSNPSWRDKESSAITMARGRG